MTSDDELIIKYLTSSSSEEENKVLLKRINENPAIKAHFKEVARTWNRANSQQHKAKFDSDKAYKDFIGRTENLNSSSKKKKGKIKHLAIAFSSIAACLLIGIGIRPLVKNASQKLLPLTNNTETPITHTLDDESVIVLNSGTSGLFPEKFTGKKRQIKMLSGEAFFQIKPDPTKTFVIDVSDKLTVEVLGTSFEIETFTNGNIEITVASGCVRVTKNNTKLYYKTTSNEKTIYSAKRDTLTKEINTNPNYLSWHTKKLIFDNTPLSTVISDIEKLYGVKITSRSCMANNRLTSKFDNQPLDEVLEILKLTFGVNMQRSSDTIIIEK